MEYKAGQTVSLRECMKNNLCFLASGAIYKWNNSFYRMEYWNKVEAAWKESNWTTLSLDDSFKLVNNPLQKWQDINVCQANDYLNRGFQVRITNGLDSILLTNPKTKCKALLPSDNPYV